MPLYAHSDIRSEGKVVFEYGDTVPEAEAKKLGNFDQLKAAGVISDQKPEPLTDLMEGTTEPE
jgi:hypothetical protein